MVENAKKYESYCLNQNVILLEQATFTIALDLHKGKFYALNSTSAAMLTLTLKHSTDIISWLTQIYDVDEEQIQDDLINLLYRLRCKGLILLKEDKVPNLLQKLCIQIRHRACTLISSVIKDIIQIDSSHGSSQLAYYILLLLSWLSFRLLGWSNTIELWQSLHTCIEPVESSKSKRIIDTVDQTIQQTASQYFLPVACKERALVGYHILRAVHHLPAVLVLGVDYHPFQLHAWVECNGQILTDDPEYCRSFNPIIKYF